MKKAIKLFVLFSISYFMTSNAYSQEGLALYAQISKTMANVGCPVNYSMNLKNSHPKNSIEVKIEISGYKSGCIPEKITKKIILKKGMSEFLGYQNVNCAVSMFDTTCRAVGYKIVDVKVIEP